MRALLATARVANVPSVVGNVWVGIIAGQISAGFFDRTVQVSEPYAGLWLLMLAGGCLYVAGNLLNDWRDRDWDRKHRPERALPRGMFRANQYLVSAVVLVLVALVCAWLVDVVAAVIAVMIFACVVIYTIVHKQTSTGVIWIGLCRGLLVVLGASGMIFSHDDGYRWSALGGAAVVGLALFLYIVGLSLSARFESKPVLPGWASVLSCGFLVLPMLVLFATGLLSGVGQSGHWLVGLLPYGLWIVVAYRRRQSTPRYVAALLAGIPLVDAMYLLPVGLALVETSVVVSPWVFSGPPLAFGAGLLLQRVAPAS